MPFTVAGLVSKVLSPTNACPHPSSSCRGVIPTHKRVALSGVFHPMAGNLFTKPWQHATPPVQARPSIQTTHVTDAMELLPSRAGSYRADVDGSWKPFQLS
jgi:hypothetical protein